MRKISRKEKPPDDEPEHPSQARTTRFEVDALLRRHGFTIHAREGNREPWWERKGELYVESAALDTLPPGELADARYAEALYYDGF